MDKRLGIVVAALIALVLIGYLLATALDDPAQAGAPTGGRTEPTATAAAEEAPPSPATPRTETETARAEVEGGTTAESPLGSLRVRVRRERDGAPAEGIGVTCRPFAAVADLAVFGPFPATDEDGIVVFADLEPGRYSVELDRGGFGSAHVEAGAQTRVDVVLPRGMTVHGTVRDPGAAPVPGAKVMLVGGRGTAHRIAVADADGRYHCEDVADGAKLQARADGYAPSLCHGVRGREGTEVELDLVLASSARRVLGQVLDSAGVPVSDAVVAFLPASVLQRKPSALAKPFVRAPFLRTGPDGRFESREVTPEAQVVVASAVDRPNDAFARSELEAGRGESYLVLQLRPGATVEGQARDGEQPLEAATIIAWVEKPDDDIGYLLNLFGLKQQVTGSGGEFALRGLAPGEYHLQALHGPKFAEHRVRLRAGERFEWNPTRDPQIAWPVRVVPAAPPVNGPPFWLITLYRRSAQGGGKLAGSASTAPDGSARITGIEPGRYDVIVSARLDFSARTLVRIAQYRDVDVRPGAEEAVLVVPADELPSARLRGRVLDRSARPAGNVRVVATRQSTVLASSVEALSGADGRFSIGPLPPGDYTVRLEAPGQDPVPAGSYALVASRDEDVGDLRLR